MLHFSCTYDTTVFLMSNFYRRKGHKSAVPGGYRLDIDMAPHGTVIP